MKKITIRYFAKLRQERGSDREIIETNASSASELFHELKNKYNFSIDESHLKVAINEQYAKFDSPLKDNDCIVFIPPVAGG